MTKPLRWLLFFPTLFFLVILFIPLGHTYPVGPSLKLDQIESQSDVLFKARVTAIHPLKEGWFEKYSGFGAYATEMQIISVIKGELPQKKIIFQHYGRVQGEQLSPGFSPQYYDFQVGKPYLVFAKKTDRKGIFRQPWKDHKSKEDQGVFRAADFKPTLKGKPIQEIVWEELIKLLNGAEKENVLYAIKQLDEMSRTAGWDKLDDFDRNRVMEKIHPFVLSKDPDITQASIRALGDDSPYLRDEVAQFWLSHIGGRKIQGYAEWDKGNVNPFASRYWNELVAVIDGAGPVENRVLAICSLGLVKKPEVFEYVKKWVNDPEPHIRQAAAILLSDYPGDESSEILTKLSDDKEASVRYGVARAVGFTQREDLLPVLEKLLNDQDVQVGSAAVESILSFEPKKVDGLLKKYKDTPDFKPLFINALAEVDAEPYLDDLAEIIKNKLESKYFRGGTFPFFLSWKILFKNIQGQSEETIRSKSMGRYLDALEGAVAYYQYLGSSGPPRDLYAFYVHYGLHERAKAFRAQCRSSIPFDMEYYFKQVDEQKDFYIDNSISQNYNFN